MDTPHRIFVKALLKWFATNARDLPWRRTRDPYGIWISEIMLQQTQVKTVIPYWERWMKELPTISALAKASQQKIHKLWEGLGYYTRVRNAQKAAQAIMENHEGKFPEDFEDILALPGIGRYTAGAIASIAFNQPTPILDGNVIRILSRIYAIEGDPKDKSVNAKLWQLANELVTEAHSIRNPKSAIRNCSFFNQSMMELGALICAPRQPACDLCPVNKICLARLENRVDELPMTAKRSAPTQRHFRAYVVEEKNRFLVRQRPAGVVNAHLWEFPNIEILTDGKAPNPFILDDSKPICRIQHSITRYRITLEVFRANGSGEGDWKTMTELKRLPFSSAHKKILGHLKS